MLSAVDVGAMQWGMDGGGFKGRPSPENYARWIQFGAFTPLFRVHGTFDEKRQPWVYGPVAEKAATAAIRLRYTLIPYIYSWMHRDHVDGIGLVRPLLFDWPHDSQVRNDVDAWLFGDGLLVSPVVEEGQRSKRIYLPAGTWTDYFTGTVYEGGQSIDYAVDSATWSDIPLFVRAGAIIPTWPPMDYVDQKPVATLDVDVFPDTRRTSFDYYDDDGRTYAYEHGAYFLQPLYVQRTGDTVTFESGAVEGGYKPALRFYLLKIHGNRAAAVDADGKPMPAFADTDALQRAAGEGWAAGHDRYGDVTWIRLAAAQQRQLALTLRHTGAHP
jgi:alpha-glucosidase (family GH31 glycosyl hydrolase)